MHTGRWGSAHTHSHFSTLDAMSDVSSLVEKASKLGQPFMALTDHGNMAGSVQLYEAGKKFGVNVFPGVEIYLLDPDFEGELKDSGKARRFHSGLAARNLDGYKALVQYVSMTHTRPRFSRFPRGTLSDLAALGQNHGDGIIYTTGCVFGLLQQTLIEKGQQDAERIVKTMASWFPNFFVELQDHGNDHGNGMTDAHIVEALHSMATRIGLPVIATPDSHYLNSDDAASHCVVGSTTVSGIGPTNGKSVEWYYNMLHGAVEATPGHCESCDKDLSAGGNVYRTRASSGTFVQIPSGKWYARIRLHGVTFQSPAGLRSEAVEWLDEKRSAITDRWLCKNCYHTRYMFECSAGTRIVGRNPEGDLSLQRMVDVVYSGVRSVLTIETEDGKSITSTPDHRHLTTNGWRRAEDITEDDDLVVYSRVSGRYDASNRPSATIKSEVKDRGKCEHCGSLDAGGHQVAHRDYTSNAAENLLLLCVACHREYDKDSRALPWTNPIGTSFSRVVSISRHETPEHVYDVVMDSEDHSWLGNGIVTHNSMMKRMVYGGAEDAFPGGPYHLPSEEWMEEHFTPKIWADVLDGCDHYNSLHDLQMPPLDKFQAQVPEMKKDPIAHLRTVCMAKLDELEKGRKLLGGKRTEYDRLLEYELDVVAYVEQGNYFLFMDMIVTRLRAKGVFMDARGSAGGSLICYLLGLTQVDPIFWQTDFDRFMGAPSIEWEPAFEPI